MRKWGLIALAVCWLCSAAQAEQLNVDEFKAAVKAPRNGVLDVAECETSSVRFAVVYDKVLDAMMAEQIGRLTTERTVKWLVKAGKNPKEKMTFVHCRVKTRGKTASGAEGFHTYGRATYDPWTDTISWSNR